MTWARRLLQLVGGRMGLLTGGPTLTIVVTGGAGLVVVAVPGRGKMPGMVVVVVGGAKAGAAISWPLFQMAENSAENSAKNSSKLEWPSRRSLTALAACSICACSKLPRKP